MALDWGGCAVYKEGVSRGCAGGMHSSYQDFSSLGFLCAAMCRDSVWTHWEIQLCASPLPVWEVTNAKSTADLAPAAGLETRPSVPSQTETNPGV